MSKSLEAFEKARQYIPGGVNSPVRSFKSIEQHPIFFKKGKGSVLTDIDDKEYIDLCASWGVAMLGHAPDGITQKVQERVAQGSSFGAPTEEETLLAQQIIKMVPSIEKVRFVNSGTEAVMSAVRLARAYTKRDIIIKFEGHYHGHADHLLVSAGSGVAETGEVVTPGVPGSFASHTLTVPFNDFVAINEIFNHHKGQIAAVIVEPVAANMGVIAPKPGFLELLRELTQKNNSLLIFDEVITGFRLAPGGAQEYYNILPDLTTLGKIIGGGFPVGALGGKKEIMDLLAPLGPVYQAGTLSGNPVAMVAGYETLKQLEKPETFKNLSQKTADFVNALSQAVSIYPVKINSVGPMFTIFFSNEHPENFEDVKQCDFNYFAWYYRSLLKLNVYMSPSQYEANFITLAHTDKQLKYLIRTLQHAISYIYGYCDNM